MLSKKPNRRNHIESGRLDDKANRFGNDWEGKKQQCSRKRHALLQPLLVHPLVELPRKQRQKAGGANRKANRQRDNFFRKIERKRDENRREHEPYQQKRMVVSLEFYASALRIFSRDEVGIRVVLLGESRRDNCRHHA